ncbi:MAG: hypothetical protein ACT4P7_04160 [Gemmatimonadaceae bacterium]
MFIRGPHPESVIWHHFRGAADGFVFGSRGAVFEAQLVPNADRTIELYLAVLEHFDPAVDVHLEDWRTGARWSGEDLDITEVRDSVARAKHALGSHAGTEVTVVSGKEQATLTPNLEVFVFSDTDRWLYLLQGKGLRRMASLRTRSWWLRRGEFGSSAVAEAAVRLTVERLHLTRLDPAPAL